MAKSIRRNFTLIELLVVMLIMGLLITVMLPAFKRMIVGNQVQQLTANLKLSLEQAQSRAITSRSYVAVVLPHPNMNNSEINSEQWFGGSRIAYVTKKRTKYTTSTDASGKETTTATREVNWEFVSWVPGQSWRPAIDNAMLLLILNESKDSGYYEKFTDGEGISFAPTNTSKIGFSNLITLEKYRPDEAGLSSSSTYTAKNVAIIFSPYGGIVGNPEYSSTKYSYSNLRFVIVEAIASDDGTLSYPSHDDNGPTNYLILEVNRFTGRTKYYTPDSSTTSSDKN